MIECYKMINTYYVLSPERWVRIDTSIEGVAPQISYFQNYGTAEWVREKGQVVEKEEVLNILQLKIS